VRVVALDRHALTIDAAVAAGPADRRLALVRGDALRLPFADGAFDYVLSSMFLHHLGEDDAAAALREMNRVAGRGVIVADLLRDARAYMWVTLFTLLAHPMVRHDARVSVAQAFSAAEARALPDRAGISFVHFHRHFGHRFVLAGEKAGPALDLRKTGTAGVPYP
jgi:ubiquinone/menaquinone biosynthesis C-methylase UbiE